ncbi:MAG: AmmeMemoRadiSam system protein B [Acidobacteria bacterium]|nr:AmmeMemoRadiSam system protein B [Acidobacteriota bacterium]
MIRTAAVAGAFYPAAKPDLDRMLRELTDFEAEKRRAIAVIGPHAGYIYSGRVAGETYRQVALPGKLVILCPNHTGRGAPVAIMSEGVWRTPLGDAPIDTELALQLKRACPLLEEDAEAHQFEHSLEVHLPFLQFLRPAFSFVPINVGIGSLPELCQIGQAIASVIGARADPVLIVSSSDMTHYEPAERARQKDLKAIGAILDLDAEKLHRTVQEHRISMCGYAPTTAALFAARSLGARQAELVRYANSGDVTGDYASVVGYAGLVIW